MKTSENNASRNNLMLKNVLYNKHYLTLFNKVFHLIRCLWKVLHYETKLEIIH